MVPPTDRDRDRDHTPSQPSIEILAFRVEQHEDDLKEMRTQAKSTSDALISLAKEVGALMERVSQLQTTQTRVLVPILLAMVGTFVAVLIKR